MKRNFSLCKEVTFTAIGAYIEDFIKLVEGFFMNESDIQITEDVEFYISDLEKTAPILFSNGFLRHLNSTRDGKSLTKSKSSISSNLFSFILSDLSLRKVFCAY